MTSSTPISAALLRSVKNMRPIDGALMRAFETGTYPTQGPSKGPSSAFNRHAGRVKSLFNRQWQRSPDRAASMRRKRTYGGCGGLPPTVRHCYTMGEGAALAVIASEVKLHGACDWPIDRIAASAGVSRTTVQNALRVARLHKHVEVQSRPRKGMKNLTNIVRIISKDWMDWIERSIGFKKLHPTKTPDKRKGNERTERPAKRAYEKGEEANVQPYQDVAERRKAKRWA